ncbi:disease resistance protein RPM1-like [Canna indica]|uniref:Disease resistance protein RPM1-like n=1 Tax=Canna indica TaxID=4628 RepID=A0AAQ3JNX1_9LILI|nr:disease resistance protein RPM1-like [Canna indica]
MEGYLAFVAGKIGSALLDEATTGATSLLRDEVSLLRKISVSMERLKNELDLMHASMDDWDKGKHNKTEEAWLKRMRDIAHKAEDVIDEYTYLITEQSRSGFIRRAIVRYTNIGTWHRIAERLKEIEDDLDHASKMKERYDIKKLYSRQGSSLIRYVNQRELINPAVEEDEIVGMKEERKALIEWLTDEAPKRKIITVWGMGGLGKTTIVHGAYESGEIEKHFDHKVWVSVSQSFQCIDLLRRILKELLGKEGSKDIESFGPDSIVEKIQGILQDKMFLVVLDDVWDPKAFFDLQSTFRNGKLGSKIVITTRIREVANLVADEHCRMELRTLTENESWALFCSRAFWKDDDKRCHNQEIEEWGRKIVGKCGDLPLAIVSIARLMSLRSQTIEEWENVHNKLIWEFNCNPALDGVKHILNVSYHDLPGYLKNCFLYCSIFPEDYVIRRNRLVNLWIAEGFVEARGAQTMEQVAEDYLNELIHRCMLQIDDWSITGKVETCRMHDLVRELTVTVATSEKFSMVVTEPQSTNSFNDARRMSIQNFPVEIRVDLSRIHSLLVFGSVGSPSSLLSSKARHLRVLDLERANISSVPNEVGYLFNLHYLSLRWTKINRLPNSVRRLRNLQSLDIRRTELSSLPKGISKLKNLRHLCTSNSYNWFSNLNAPRGLWNLTCLQTLQISANKELVERLGKLSQLRKLEIKVGAAYCPQLFASLLQMPFLSRLSIRSNDMNEELMIQFKEFSCVFKNLEKLRLHFSINAKMSDLVGLLGDKLRKLSLGRCQLKDDPLPVLSRLSNLIMLKLVDDAYSGKQLCFGVGWFPNLKVLRLADLPNLNEIKMEQGSMGNLQILVLTQLPNLKQVPEGIEFQTTVKELRLWKCTGELVEMIKGGQKHKVDHIPYIRNRILIDDVELVIEVIR